MDKSLKFYLENLGITYKKHEHPAVFTVKESRKIKSQFPALGTKSLFLKSDKGNFYLVCMPGEKRLNIKKLRKSLKERKLHFASSEELNEYLNVTPGSVSIFCTIHANSTNLHLLVDKEVWFADSVGFHPNINTSTLEVSHSDLEKFYNSLKIKKQIINLESG